MRLDRVEWLWLLWLLPVLAIVLRVAQGRARSDLERFAGGLAPRLVRAGGAHAARAALVLCALAAAVLALARPAWGVYYEEVRSEGLEMVALLDVSRSMLAEDAAPNRLERARIALGRLLDRVEERGGHRIGLVAFAGLPVVRCPVTADYRYCRDALHRTQAGDVPRGGTLIGDAVRRALALLDRPGDHERVILLLTDGEDHESFPLEAARAAAEAGVRIYAIGIGDPAGGGRVPVTDEAGLRSYLEHDGAPVVSRLDEATLREMTAIAGGAYVPAGTRTIPLEQVYDDVIAPGGGATLDVTQERRLHERFQWAVALALLFAVASRFSAPRPERRWSGEGAR